MRTNAEALFVPQIFVPSETRTIWRIGSFVYLFIWFILFLSLSLSLCVLRSTTAAALVCYSPYSLSHSLRQWLSHNREQTFEIFGKWIYWFNRASHTCPLCGSGFVPAISVYLSSLTQWALSKQTTEFLMLDVCCFICARVSPSATPHNHHLVLILTAWSDFTSSSNLYKYI